MGHLLKRNSKASHPATTSRILVSASACKLRASATQCRPCCACSRACMHSQNASATSQGGHMLAHTH
eukprot:259529-Rhodomonas_salina.1